MWSKGLLTVIILALTPSMAMADGGMFHFGLQTGPTFINGSSGTFGLGITSTYRIKPFLSVGFYFFTAGVGASANGDASQLQTSSTSQGRTFYGGEMNLVMGGNLAPLSPGIRVGMVGISTSATATSSSANIAFSNTSTNLYLQPKLGYDIFFSKFSFGPELSYSIVIAGASSLNFMGTFKFWL